MYKLSGQRSTFAQQVDGEYQVNLEIEKINPLVKQFPRGFILRNSLFDRFQFRIRGERPSNFWPLSLTSYCTCYATVLFPRRQAPKRPVPPRKIWHHSLIPTAILILSYRFYLTQQDVHLSGDFFSTTSRAMSWAIGSKVHADRISH